jgi:hypothetical protein
MGDGMYLSYRSPGRLVLALVLMVAAVPGCTQGSPDAPVRDRDAVNDMQPPREGLTGRIVANDGSPIEGALIVPRSLQAHGPPIPEMATLSDADGRYVWPLPAGAYEVSVFADGYHDAVQRADVAADVVVTLDIVLKRSE